MLPRILRRTSIRRLLSSAVPTAAAPAPTSTPAPPAAPPRPLPGVRAEEDALVLVFTCTVCDTRTARRVSKSAYHGGTVLIRCPGCRGMHLLADHKGFFHDGAFSAEDVLRARGEGGARAAGGDDAVLELRDEDFAALRAMGGSVRLSDSARGAAGEEPAVVTFEGAVREAAEDAEREGAAGAAASRAAAAAAAAARKAA